MVHRYRIMLVHTSIYAYKKKSSVHLPVHIHTRLGDDPRRPWWRPFARHGWDPSRPWLTAPQATLGREER